MADYATVAEVNQQMHMDVTKYEDKIEVLITNVSRMIDLYCMRLDGFVADSVSTARTFVGSGMPVQRIDETPEVTLVEVKNSITDTSYTSWETTDWVAFRGSVDKPNFNPLLTDNPKPFSGLAVLLSGAQSHFTSGLANLTRPGFRPPIVRVPTDFGQPTIRITAKWGFAVIRPPTINQAALTEISRWFGNSEANWTDTLASSDFQELRVSKDLNPITKMMLNNSGLKRR